MSDRSPIRRALLGVYDKTGIEELARGLAGGRGRAGQHRRDRAPDRRRRHPGHPGRAGDRLPRVPGRAGEDAAPRACTPGILADRRKPEHVAQLDELGIAAFDLVVVNLYPFTETVASGASPDECVEQIDIGGPAMVRAAAKNHPSVAVVVDPARYADVLAAVADGRLHPRRAAAAGRGRLPAHRVLRHRRRLVDGQRPGARRGDRLPGVGRPRAGSGPTCCATARTRTRAPRSTAAACSRAWRTPSSCTARRCPTTTTSTPTPPGGPRTTTPTRASRSSSTPTRAASPSAPTSPPRTARRTPATRCRRSAA